MYSSYIIAQFSILTEMTMDTLIYNIYIDYIFADSFSGGFHICVINDMNTRKHTSQLITGETFYTVTEKIKLSDTVGVCLCTCHWKLGGGGGGQGFPVTSALQTIY